MGIQINSFQSLLPAYAHRQVLCSLQHAGDFIVRWGDGDVLRVVVRPPGTGMFDAVVSPGLLKSLEGFGYTIRGLAQPVPITFRTLYPVAVVANRASVVGWVTAANFPPLYGAAVIIFSLTLPGDCGPQEDVSCGPRPSVGDCAVKIEV